MPLTWVQITQWFIDYYTWSFIWV